MSQKKSLKDIQKKTLEKIVSLSLTEGFYLAGGTALTIRYENYNLGIFLKSLTYFEDAEREKNPYIDPFWENIKNFMSLLIKSEYKLYDHPSP